MEPKPLESEDSSRLDELIEYYLQRLLEKLARPHSLNDVEADLANLNDLIYSFKRKDELLEKLIDNATPEHKRRQIFATLKANHIKIAENKLELEQLHAKSHQLLERTMLLIMKAQWQIQKEAHKSSGYKLESCNNCEGSGRGDKGRCPVCKGTGNLLKHQPTTDSLS